MKELIIFSIAASPIVELRGSLIVGVLLDMPLHIVIPLSIAGNALSAGLLIWLLPYAEKLCCRITLLDRLLQKVFTRTRHKHSHRVSVLGESALVAFVGIPLPGTGAWTGALLAHIFALDRKKSFLLICLGLCISAAIMLILIFFFHEIFTLMSHSYEEYFLPLLQNI